MNGGDWQDFCYGLEYRLYFYPFYSGDLIDADKADDLAELLRFQIIFFIAWSLLNSGILPS